MSLKNAVGGVLLIAGTAIGAAVLALPVSTSELGFVNATLYFVITWIFMTLAALYLLEANLREGYGSNIISMARDSLGRSAELIAWLLYLVLFYALNAAYFTGAGAWIYQAFQLIGISLPPIVCALIAVGITFIIILTQIHSIDLLNRLLMAGLLLAFGVMLFTAVPAVTRDLLLAPGHRLVLSPLPLMVTAFGFSIIVPTLTEYLHGRGSHLKYVILIGSLFPILIYIIWEALILGIIPITGQTSLTSLAASGKPAVEVAQALSQLLELPWLTRAASVFSIFALITSILGVSLSMFDFLADGLHQHKSFRGKLWLATLTFTPPLLFIVFYPEGFIYALNLAGVFVAILLGILPVMMVWQGRYRKKMPSSFRVCGGKPVLILTSLYFLGIIAIEVCELFKIPLPFL